MTELKVDAAEVVAIAGRIKNQNDLMRSEFDAVQQAINKLDLSWDSPASTNAIDKFSAIKNAYCDNRYNVVDYFVAFLYQQVGEGYTQTESVNKSLADQFK